MHPHERDRLRLQQPERDTVSIECCHPDATGKFTDATYDSLVQLTAFLCSKFNLTENDVIRHYDITGKYCPKYFVENEAAWETFRSDVGAVLAERCLRRRNF